MRSRPFLSAALCLALAISPSILSSQAAPTPSLTLFSKDGRRPLPIVMVGEQEFIGLDDLAIVFQLAVHEESGAITVSYKGKTIVLTPDQTLASVSGRLISLPAPPARNGRRWLVPLEFISRALAPIYDVRLDLRKPSHLLVVGDVRVPRITVRYDPLGGAGRLTIDATPRATSTVLQEGEHLTIKFDADALDVANPPLPPQGAQSLVQTVRIVDATSIAVDLGPRFAGFRASAEPVDTTVRLVIDVVAAQTDAAPVPPPAGGAAGGVPPPPELPPALTTPAIPIRTIALDPGHGGDDEGVKGAAGAKEKDLTLSIARRVKTVIEARLGIRVLLTRDEDRRVPLDERTAIANNNKADLFISLHANASMRHSTSGAAIFYAAFDETALATGAFVSGAERLPTFGGGLRDIELVPWDLAQTRHIGQSSAFAAMLEQQFHDRLPLTANPVERAPMRVLESSNMPAVLIELGYLTNPDQEKLLTGEAFQNAFVQAIYDTVVRFRDSLTVGGTQ